MLGELFDALGLSRVICEVMHFFGIGFAVVEFGAERAVFAPEVESLVTQPISSPREAAPASLLAGRGLGVSLASEVHLCGSLAINSQGATKSATCLVDTVLL